jgi:hypothetical protein
MRRRVWNSIVTMDAVSSFMVGLPSMTRTIDYDCGEPRNIHDWELYEGMTELPASRPPSEATPVSYLLAKARLLRPLGDVVDFISSPHSDSYDRALQIDEQLSNEHLQMPSHLRLRDIEQTTTYSAAAINRMVQIEFLFHQGVCVLHRRFLARGRLDHRYARSREQCIKSALALLNHQRVLYEVATKTGSLRDLYWFRMSFTSHAFILPAVILCLDLRHSKRGFTESDQSNSWNGDTQDKAMLDAVRTAQTIWKEGQDMSPETWKVHRVLSQLLESLDAGEKDDSLQSRKLEPALAIPEPVSLVQNGKLDLDQSISTSVYDMDIDWVSLLLV